MANYYILNQGVDTQYKQLAKECIELAHSIF